MSDYDLYTAFTIVIFGFAIWLIASGFREYQFSQKMKNTATSKIGSAAIGLTEIFSRAACTEPELSPVSKTPCIFWKVTVHEFAQYAQEQDIKTPLAQCESDKLFYIQDDTGRMLVDPAGAKIDIPIDRKYEGYVREIWSFIPGTRHMLDATAMQYIDMLDEPVKRRIKKCEYVLVREYLIEDNDQLYVMGSVMPQDDTAVPHNESLIIRKGPYDKVMYISNKSEKKLIEKHLMWAYPKIVAGLPLSAGSLFVILVMLNQTNEIGHMLMNVFFMLVFSIILMTPFLLRFFRHDHY